MFVQGTGDNVNKVAYSAEALAWFVKFNTYMAQGKWRQAYLAMEQVELAIAR